MRRTLTTLAVSALLLWGATPAVAQEQDGFTANVMAPLQVTDWADFESDLAAVAAYGVDAVSVDVWWGLVEPVDNGFDWAYYDRVFGAITAAGLDVAPILSFHRCGGNVGDDCDIPLPAWLWDKYAGEVGPVGLQHRSEQGNTSPETVQGWADDVVAGEYTDLTRAFADHFAPTYDADVVEVNVSLGPSGELRYPAYNAHDTGSGYPSRGALQAYSDLAVADLRADMIARHGSLDGVNAAWGTALTSVEEIRPPQDADNFFTGGAYRDSAYGRDFVDWYHSSLVEHGQRMLTTVVAALGSDFAGADIGYKVPGIHWTITNPAHPRATEITTGLITTAVDVDSDATGHGYQRIIDLANQVDGGGRDVVLHFTALEMSDDDVAPQYSLAATLVGWFGKYAESAGVRLKGENALAGGVASDAGWDNIDRSVASWGYDGLTVLRVGDVADGVGAARYAQLIAGRQ